MTPASTLKHNTSTPNPTITIDRIPSTTSTTPSTSSTTTTPSPTPSDPITETYLPLASPLTLTLLLLSTLRFALQTSLTVSLWNTLRLLGSPHPFSPSRIITEAFAALFIALTHPEADVLLNYLSVCAGVDIRFEAREMRTCVAEGLEMARITGTAAWIGSAIHLGVRVGVGLEGRYRGRMVWVMYVGYFVAFTVGGLGLVLGEILLQKRVVRLTRPPRAALETEKVNSPSWSHRITKLAKATFGLYTPIDIWLFLRLPLWIVWFAYNFYWAGMDALADSPGGKEAALWGSLWVLVLSVMLVLEFGGRRVR